MTEPNPAPRTLAIDIGGSGIKMLILNLAGEAITKRTRVATPDEPTPPAVMDAILSLIPEHGDIDRISVGFPGVVVEGEVRTAVNLHPDWVGFNLADALRTATGKPARVANDADVQGLGVIAGRGVELVLTLGTGVGSALFIDGHLVPNLELPHHPFRKSKTYEESLGAEALKDDGKSKWNRRLLEAIERLERLFNYRALYLGGGNAKKIEVELPANVHIVPNIAGLLGGIALWRDPGAEHAIPIQDADTQ